VGDVDADALAAFDDHGRRRGPGDQALHGVLMPSRSAAGALTSML
jgi:hypothetical protein